MQVPFIDLKTQYAALEDKIKTRIETVLSHGRFILGPEVQEFEEQLAQFIGCKHVISCGSGTQALTLAMMTAGLKPGGEVITTPFSFFATVDTIINLGLTPIFVDIDPQTYNIDASQIESKITDKTVAILPVSLYGQAADMDEINAIAQKHNLVVIEDAAQSCGAPYKNKRSGDLCDFATTSFYPAKSLGAYGDAGAMMTNGDEKAELARQLRIHGQPSGYHHTNIGINSRMDTMQAAILLVKLERYPWEIEQRNRVAQLYFENLGKYQVPTIREDRGSVWAQFTIEVDNRDEVRKALGEKGVPTAVHYPKAIPDQPIIQKLYPNANDVPNARRAADRVMSLPMFPDMTDEQCLHVCKSIQAVLG